MDLTQLANLGEFVGGVAVLVTLIYLAIQVRQNTQSVRRANARQTTSMNGAVLRAFATHSEVMAPLGFRNTEDLTPAQDLEHTMIWATWLQCMEQTLADVREGSLAPEFAVPYEDLLRRLLDDTNARDWWSNHRTWFSMSFQRDVERLMPSNPGS